MRLLLVEDDTSLAEMLIYGLEEEGFAVDLSQNGTEALMLALTKSHDLILLDKMLPGISGEEVLIRLRKAGIEIPVIFITAIGDSTEKIHGLNSGADDYLVKPFEIGELLARIRSVMRRIIGSRDPFTISYDTLTYHEQQSKLTYKNNSIILSPKEGELLSYFLRHPDKVLSRDQIIGNVWGADTDIEDGNLDNYIYLLRKNLASLTQNVKIVTVHRQGYRITNSI